MTLINILVYFRFKIKYQKTQFCYSHLKFENWEKTSSGIIFKINIRVNTDK